MLDFAKPLALISRLIFMINFAIEIQVYFLSVLLHTIRINFKTNFHLLLFSAQMPSKFQPSKTEANKSFMAKLKHRKVTEYEIKQLLSEVSIYLVYITIVLTIAYGYRDQHTFLQKQSLESSIIHGGLSCEIVEKDDPRYKKCTNDDYSLDKINFMKTKSVNDWYKWLDKTLFPNVRVQPWYNGKQPYGLRGYLDDRANQIIGYAIIRQIRQKEGHCRTAKILRDSFEDRYGLGFEDCLGDYNIGSEDQAHYCKGWIPNVQDPDLPDLPCNVSEEYHYKSSSELESMPISAGFRTYSGGGYMFRIKGPIDELKERIKSLKKDLWVDDRTRALIVEFSVYNAQVRYS